MDDLTAEAEEAIIIGENLADQLGRRLLESRRAALEHVLLERRRKGQGHRSDLATSADTSGGSRVDARDIVAKELGVARNAVADRQTIFYSPISPEAVKRAADSGEISRSEAARVIRAAQRGVAEVLEEARSTGTPFEQITMLPEVVAAKSKVATRLQRPSAKKPTRIARRPASNEAEGVLVDDVCELDYLGMRMRVEVANGKVRVLNVGPAHADSGADAGGPITRSSWVVDVAAATGFLPDDIRERVRVGDVEVLDPVHCPDCGGTRFYLAGGCVTCRPMTYRPCSLDFRAQAEQQMSAAMRPSRELLLAQLRASVASFPTEEEAQFLTFARNVVEVQIWQAARDHAEALASEALAAARALDERHARPAAGRIEDLRYPRTRIRITTPNSFLDVVLWERAGDCGRFTSLTGPEVLIGTLGESFDWMRLGQSGFDMGRYAFRDAVVQLLQKKLGNARAR